MTDRVLTITDVLDPLKEDEFFGDIVTVRDLTIRAEGDRKRSLFGELLNLSTFEQLAYSLIDANMRACIELAKDGMTFDVKQVYDEHHRYLRIADLAKAYAGGMTVTLRHLRRRHVPIALLCAQLEDRLIRHGFALPEPIFVGAFLTPRSSKGYGGHFDHSETLVLQVEGSKTWNVYGEVGDWRSLEMNFLSEAKLGKPQRVVELHPGDVLYFPAGYGHDAYTTTTHSLHISIAIPAKRVASESTTDSQQTATICENWESYASDRFLQINALPRIRSSTRVQKRHGARFAVKLADDALLVSYPGATQSYPLAWSSAVEHLTHAESCLIQDLPSTYPMAQRMQIVAQLILDDFLTITSPTS